METGRANRTCAVCSKPIRNRDICNKCFKEWGNGGNYPLWLKELISLQSHYERAFSGITEKRSVELSDEVIYGKLEEEEVEVHQMPLSSPIDIGENLNDSQE